MDITIAITNHNQEETLSKAIFSIYNQTEIPTSLKMYPKSTMFRSKKYNAFRHNIFVFIYIEFLDKLSPKRLPVFFG